MVSRAKLVAAWRKGDRDLEQRIAAVQVSGGSGGGGSPSWASITGKPSTFTPSTHTHTASDVTGLPTAARVEIDMGSGARRSGRATITDAAITAATKLLVTLAPGPYTGKGTLADEAEFIGPVAFSAVAGDGAATVYWSSPFVQRGAVAINYMRA